MVIKGEYRNSTGKMINIDHSLSIAIRKCNIKCVRLRGEVKILKTSITSRKIVIMKHILRGTKTMDLRVKRII